MYFEEFVRCAMEQGENEMVVRGCNAVGYVYNLIVRYGSSSLHFAMIDFCIFVLIDFYFCLVV